MRKQPERIRELLNAVYPSFALLAGMQLDLFTSLEEGPADAKTIAARLNVHPRSLSPLLYALVTAGLLQISNGAFLNTDETGEFLVRGKPNYLGEVSSLTANNWERVLKTAAVIRNGGPLMEYDYHSTDEDLEVILRGLYPATVRDARMLADNHDFSKVQSLLDIGGGSGGFAITMASMFPHLQATVLDLPEVIPLTRQFIAESGLENRVFTDSSDAVNGQIKGFYDVVVARHLVQVFSENDAQKLFQNIAGALKPNGILYVIGWILDDSRVSPVQTVGHNLILLTGYRDGKAYTETEYLRWLDDSGFTDINRDGWPDGESVIRASKTF